MSAILLLAVGAVGCGGASGDPAVDGAVVDAAQQDAGQQDAAQQDAGQQDASQQDAALDAGDGGVAPFAISLDGDVSVELGVDGHTTITLTRETGFTDVVSVAITGLPTGVTASPNPVVFGGTTAEVAVAFVVAPDTAATGPLTLTWTAGAGSFLSQATNALTVLATAGFDFQLGEDHVGLLPGGMVDVPVTVTRSSGFSGDITFTVTGLPTGVTAAPITLLGGATMGTITLVADMSTAMGQDVDATVSAASGAIERMATLRTTVQFLPTFEVEAPTAPIVISQGTSVGVPVTLVRNSGSDTQTMTVTISGLPTGVTAAETSIMVVGPDTLATFQLTASAGATITTATIAVQAVIAAYGVVRDTSFELTVGAAPSFTASLDASDIVLDQAGSGELGLTITRDIGFTDALTVEAVAAVTGVSLVSTSVPLGETTATLVFNATASARVDLPRVFSIAITSGATSRTVEVTVRVRPVDATLDASFGFHGVHLVTNGGFEDFADVVCDAAGACFVAASRGDVIEFGADGEPDATFGGDGRANAPGPSGPLYGGNLTLQADGKVVHAGLYGDPDARHMVVTRFTTAGALDDTFGAGGQLDFVVPGSAAAPVALLYRSSGVIFVAGNVTNTTSDIFVARITSTGALDGAFGVGGVHTIDLGGDEWAETMLGYNGIVVGGFQGNNNNQALIVRINPDGTYDTAFDGDGVAFPALSPGCTTARVVALLDAGTRMQVVTSGSGTDCGAVVRSLMNNGSLDTAYGTNGFAGSSFGFPFPIVNAAMRDASGRVVVVGSFGDLFAIARFSSAGGVDTTFATAGLEILEFDPDLYEAAQGIALGPDGTYVVVGGGGHPYGSIARLLP